MRETGPPGDHAASDLLTPGVTVAVGVDPSEEVAGASQDMALVLPSLLAPASPSASLGTGAPCLDDDVLHQFDATHRLSELTAAWGNLVTFATSFWEKLQVSFLKFFLWVFIFLLFWMSCFSLSLFAQFFLVIILAYFSRLKPRKSCLLR